ncbi:cytochrome c biogenesis protein CcsA [Bacteroides sp. 519]|uniref:cytochrome c biogenesis protein CcsA n=1 Tax=Bacteroides sp. 519 TaxID=2302937 RepID=UPI001EF19DCE|nr:cytochrome c biogenesis protein CcsA [Bacteroides sp. 519]
MGKSLKQTLSSYKTSIYLLLIYAFLLAFATVIEKYGGTPVAKAFVYYSPILYILYGLIIVNFFAVSIKHNLLQLKRWGFLLVHLSFVIIVTGALVTHVFGEEGTIHLREGETTDYMIVQNGIEGELHLLPFKITLVKFNLERYPGSSSPSSYQSKLIIHADGRETEQNISMNHVLDIKGYRLFQASYDKDLQGSILSANKDVAGRNITYTGYLLLFIGFICCFTGSNTRFRRLARQLKHLTIVAFLFAPLTLNAQVYAAEIFLQSNDINKEHARLFGLLPIQSGKGRVEPVNTFSSEILRKLHKSSTIGVYTSDQFLLSVFAESHKWMYIPFIAYSNKDIAFNYDLNEEYCSFAEMFDSNGNYKLEGDLAEVFAKPPNKRTKYDKDLIKLDEQINIFYQLINSFLVDGLSFKNNDAEELILHYRSSVIDAVKSGNWQTANDALLQISNWQNEHDTAGNIHPHKLKAEVLYNKVDIFKKCQRLYLALGASLLIVCLLILFRNTKRINWVAKVLAIHLWVVLFIQLAGIIMRWYIAGYAPWSNSYETMILLSFFVVLGGLLFSRKHKLPLALSALFAGVILFVSGLNWMNPQITPLVPVLKSPWLMIHVAVIMAAYGFFGISFLFGITNLILLRIKTKTKLLALRIKELTIMNEMSLLIGLAFMAIGIFVGAIWANESWGRYWGWDPKETWALITLIVYVVATHLRLVKKWDNPFLFNLVSVLAFICVLMTYFGVNYLLSGMHSYG